ncbi:7689_t:CDS:2, partial [Scutellospora calospora]
PTFPSEEEIENITNYFSDSNCKDINEGLKPENKLTPNELAQKLGISEDKTENILYGRIETLAEVKTFETPIKANSTNGLKKDSKILLNRLRAIDKELRLRGYCGIADKETMKKVDQGLEAIADQEKEKQKRFQEEKKI